MKPMIMRELYPEKNYCREQGYLASFHKFVDEWSALISSKLGQQLDRSVGLESPIQQAFASSPSSDFFNQLRWVDLQLKGLQHILPRIEAMAKAQHLHLQHPFFQANMIELGIDLPNHLKLSGATDKVLLKMLARSHLPDAVIDTTYTDSKDGQVGVVGYEINFNRYFYVFEQPRHPNEIMAEINALNSAVPKLEALEWYNEKNNKKF